MRKAALTSSALIALFPTVILGQTITIEPGPDAEEKIQEAMILAAENDVIHLNAGVYSLKNELSLDIDNITIEGEGMDKTILSFKDQASGAEGLLVTSNGVILKDFAIEDAKGDAFKSKGVDGIAYIRVRAEWTNGPDEKNGSYGLYPVLSKNVLIDGCVAIGASDAGIYVGQSQNIIIRNSRAELNVAGFEIENSYFADMYDNLATKNTGGILSFDLPDLQQTGGHDIRIFHNRSIANNTPNFAPEGNIVGLVPSGTGMMIMANHDVEIFENEFDQNGIVDIIISSYPEETDDESYWKHPARVHIHNNTFKTGRESPDDSQFGKLLSEMVGTPSPEILWDGVMPLWRYFIAGLKSDDRHSIHDNSFQSEGEHIVNANMMTYFIMKWYHEPKYGQKEFSAELAPLEPTTVTIRGENIENIHF